MTPASAPAKAAPTSEPVRRPAPAPQPATAPAAAAPHTALPAYLHASGTPLDAADRQRFDASFRHDFSNVRLHYGAGAEVDRLSPGAQAVTMGTDVYFKQAAPTADTGELLAHELTHVVQQRGATTASVQASGSGAQNVFEAEAQRNALAFRHGGSATVSHHTASARPQAEEEQSHGWFYSLVVRAVPSLQPVLDRGIFNWISDRGAEIAEGIVEAIRAPLDTIGNVVQTISTHVGSLIDWVKKAVAALMKGDCSVFQQGIDDIEKAIDGLTAPAFEAVKSAFEKVSKFFNGLWERFGAPLWSKVKEYAGRAWNKIEEFFGWVRQKIQPLIDRVLSGWKKVKTWLGIGDDPDSQNGLLPWAERKLEAVWEKVKVKLEPIKKPLMVVGGILVLLSPAGPFLAVGAAIGGVIEAVRWIKRTFGTRNGVVSMREMLQRVILPKMISAVTSLAELLADKAGTILSKLLTVKEKLDDAASAAAASVLSFLARPIQFVGGLVKSFVDFAKDKLHGFVQLVATAARGFARFLGMVLDALDEIAKVVHDIMRIEYLLMGKLWHLIPSCIRDPFIDFLGLQILGRVPLFQAIAGTPEAWAKTKKDVQEIIKTIFVDFDFAGALKKVFVLMLRVLDVPLELLNAVLAKTVQAWDTIKTKPVQFIVNLYKTIALAFKGFFKNILTHLGHGIVGWLTGQLKGADIVLPNDWTDLGQIFRFVASVMGLSVNHVCDLLDQRGMTGVSKVVRTGARLLGEAWDWLVLVATGDFAGFWQKIKDKIGDIKETIISGVVTWVMEEVVSTVMLQLASTADPTGISETIVLIIDTYRVIKTAVQYMRQILEMLNRMLDAILNIASGVLQPAADLVETAMDMAMPVVIGFLANLAGIGDAGEKIRGIVMKIREKVDAAILWLIDKAKGMLQTISSAVGAVKNWWRERFSTKVGDETHTITAHGEGADAEVYIESSPQRMTVFLDNLLADHPDADPAAVKDIRGYLSQIDTLKQGSMGQKAGGEIADLMGKIASRLKDAVPGAELPVSVVAEHETKDVDGSIVGKHVKLEPLSLKPPAEGEWRGSEPGYGNAFFRAVNQRAYTYVQGHLLNHHLFGPGKDFNLVPISRSLNTQMSADCEEPVKEAVLDERKVVSYDVSVAFGNWSPKYKYIPEENLLPTSMTLKAYEMKKKPKAKGDQPGDWVRGKAIFTGTLGNERGPDGPPGGVRRYTRVNLNSRGADALDALQTVWGIGAVNAGKLVSSGRRYTTFEDVISDLKLPKAAALEHWQHSTDPVIALDGKTE